MTVRSGSSIPQGTLDMLILSTLARVAELHGFEIADAIESRSGRVFFVEEGSLYPALQRILLKGWVAARWGRTSENRRARYYRITAGGRKQLTREITEYERVAQAIGFILQPND